jgi:hypothetical protein
VGLEVEEMVTVLVVLERLEQRILVAAAVVVLVETELAVLAAPA